MSSRIPTDKTPSPRLVEADPSESMEARLAPQPCVSQTERIEQLEHALSEQEHRLAGLVRIAANLGKSRDPKKAMRAMVVEISGLLHADRTTIYALDTKSQMLRGLAVQGETSVEVGVELGRGIAGRVAQRGRSINLKDAYQHPNFDRNFDQLTGYRTRSMLVVPMRNPKREVIGVLQVLNKHHDGYFTLEDELVLKALGSQAAITLEALQLQLKLNITNAELRDLSSALQNRVHELELLYNAERRSSITETTEELLARELQQLAEVARCEAVALFLPDLAQGVGPAYLRTSALEQEMQIVCRCELGDGLLGKAANRAEGLVLSGDTFEEQHLPRELGGGLKITVDNAVVAPLTYQGKHIGTLALLNRQGTNHRDDAEDLRLAVLMAGQLTRAVTRVARRESAQQRDRLTTIGRMLSGVIHDLKGPMAIISGYSQLMVDVDDPDRREQMSESIRRQVLLFNDMTLEVLSFARGERSVLVSKVYLNRFVKAVSETLTPEFEERGVGFEVHQIGKGVAWFDEAKMLRVVTNIARNARQAMGTKGTFTWTITETEGEGVEFRLADNGPGIPVEIRDQVFEAFTTAGKRDGTGLGLAIVRRIVEDHGGTITFTTRTGEGTEFVIQLPPPERSE